MIVDEKNDGRTPKYCGRIGLTVSEGDPMNPNLSSLISHLFA